MNIKICGIKTIEVAQAAIQAGASHIGFIFFEKSPRYITPQKVAEIAYQIKGKVKIVAVVVNPSDELLNKITSLFAPDYIQLHGSETAERVHEIKKKYGLKIIKAISLSDKKDVVEADKYKNIAEYIMFDARPPKDSKLPGGNAVSFDWKILSRFSANYKWILSGGLTPENVNEALNITNASFLDVSSGVESSPGNKDISRIKRFIEAATK